MTRTSEPPGEQPLVPSGPSSVSWPREPEPAGRSVAARLRARVELAELDRQVLQRWADPEVRPDDPRWEDDGSGELLLVEEWQPLELSAADLLQLWLADGPVEGLDGLLAGLEPDLDLWAATERLARRTAAGVRGERDPADRGDMDDADEPEHAGDPDVQVVEQARAQGRVALPERVLRERVQARRDLLLRGGPAADPDWRERLARYRQGGREQSRVFAQDCADLADLAAAVPRSLGDERGATPWTSFLREIAVARAGTVRSAARDVRHAHLLVASLPAAVRALTRGLLPVAAARALLDVADSATGEVGLEVLDALVDRACLLPAWQVRQEALAALLRADADAAAARAARARRDRHARLDALDAEQAQISLVGPAVPLVQAWAALEADARALKAAGDPRTIGQLRFDLGATRLLAGHVQPHLVASVAASVAASAAAGAAAAPAGGCRGGRPVPVRPLDTGCLRWLTDQRFSRAVQVSITVPVTTARGLADDPAYLAGYGWISAPSARVLLPAAELRQLCVAAAGEPGAGTVLDRASRAHRPPPTPEGVAGALEAMMTEPFPITDAAWRTWPQHDPPPALAALVRARDGHDDGPVGERTPARSCDLDHAQAWPTGPTAAYNLRARSRRTHLHKHDGWEGLATSTGTVWTSPAGQRVLRPRTPHTTTPPPQDAVLPEPRALAALDHAVTGTQPLGARMESLGPGTRSAAPCAPRDEPAPF